MAEPVERLLRKTSSQRGCLYTAVSRHPDASGFETSPPPIRRRRRLSLREKRGCAFQTERGAGRSVLASVCSLKTAVGRHIRQMANEVPEILLAAKCGVYALFVLTVWAVYALFIDPILNPLDSQRVLGRQRELLAQLEGALASHASWVQPLVGPEAPFTAAQRFSIFLKEAAQTTRGPPQESVSALLLLFLLQLAVLGGQTQFASASRTRVERHLQKQRERLFSSPVAGEGARKTPSLECTDCQMLTKAVAMELVQRRAFEDAAKQLLQRLQLLDISHTEKLKNEKRRKGTQFRPFAFRKSQESEDIQNGNGHQQHPCVAELVQVMQLGAQDAENALMRIENHKQRLLLLHQQREHEIHVQELDNEKWILTQQQQQLERALLRHRRNEAAQEEDQQQSISTPDPQSLDTLESMRANLEKVKEELDVRTEQLATQQALLEKQKHSLQQQQKLLEQRHIAFRRAERSWSESCQMLFRSSSSWLHVLLHPPLSEKQ